MSSHWNLKKENNPQSISIVFTQFGGLGDTPRPSSVTGTLPATWSSNRNELSLESEKREQPSINQ
jgi:hypothetical protein